MDLIIGGIKSAYNLIISQDPYIYEVIFLTIKVSFSAIIISAIFGIPTGFLIANSSSDYKKIFVIIFNTLLALPTVVIGIILYAILSRQGMLGFFLLLYTPYAIIIGEVILAFPIICALTISTVNGIDYRVFETTKTLGASKFQTLKLILNENKISFVTVVMTAFGRVLTELGVALIVGGNIKGFTRTMTTAITLEIAKGELGKSFALGFILLTIALIANLIVTIRVR